MESDDSVTEILEVPGQFQKPHEIFISEQADWSFENGVKEETDPLCLEEEEDCENVEGGEDKWQPEETIHAIKEDPTEPPRADLLPLVKQEQESSDLPSDDSFGASAVPHVKEESSDLPSNDSIGASADPPVKEIQHSTTAALSFARPARRVLRGFSQYWLKSLEEVGYIRCPLRACNYISLSYQDMCVHYAFCAGVSVTSENMCPVCQKRLNTAENVKLHLIQSHGAEAKHQEEVQSKPSPKRSSPAPESATGYAFVKMEPAPPDDEDVCPESGLEREDWSTASRGQKAGDDADEVADRGVVCSEHRKQIRYSHIITMCIMDSPHWRMTLSGLYTYTMDHFPGICHRRHWQSSIRQNLSASRFFVKTAHRVPNKGNAHYWTLEPVLLERLRAERGRPGRHCCRWKMVRQVHIACSRTPHREPPPLRSPPPPRSPPPRQRRPDSKNSTSGRKNSTQSPRRSSKVVCRIRFPLHDSQKNSRCPDLSQPVADSTTDPGDEADRSCSALGPAPPLKPLIARAIMLSPNRLVPLSAIYSYCMEHCPYYKDSSEQCWNVIRCILETEVCFQTLAQGGCWAFDTRHKDVLESGAGQPAGGEPWEHDHGLYPKQLLPDAGEGRSPDTEVTDTASEPSSDTDDDDRGRRSRKGLPEVRRTYTGRSGGGAQKRKKATVTGGESELGCSPKRHKEHGHHLESLPRHGGLHSDDPFPDKPVGEEDELDIKEEPFHEELLTENACEEGKGEQNTCTTLLDAECYKTERIKQEQEEYPITVKYEMVGTWC